MVLAGALALGLLSALLAVLYLRQEALLFHPERLPADHRFALRDVEEVRIPVDGATLSALHLKLPEPRGVVFFLHGNAGNLESWFVNLDLFRDAGFDLFMIDYRGYGKSTGAIRSEAALRADVDTAWRTIEPSYRGVRIVVFGRSLGTALAAGLAAKIQPDLTILVSPFFSMEQLQRLHYAHLPRWLLRYPLKTCDDVARIGGPVLLIHGDRDMLIPDDHSSRLRALAPSARVVLIPGAAHDLQDFGDYLQVLADALQRVTRGAVRPDAFRQR
jgi:uncharacterized protein